MLFFNSADAAAAAVVACRGAGDVRTSAQLPRLPSIQCHSWREVQQTIPFPFEARCMVAVCPRRVGSGGRVDDVTGRFPPLRQLLGHFQVHPQTVGSCRKAARYWTQWHPRLDAVFIATVAAVTNTCEQHSHPQR